jgi:protein arginine N-methyltransferase 1
MQSILLKKFPSILRKSHVNSAFQKALLFSSGAGVGHQARTDDVNCKINNISSKIVKDPSSQDTDFEMDYFSVHAYPTVWGHKVMLDDPIRMTAYHDAIMKNKDLFKDKVVMDIGTGTGVLSLWAAQAGAKKVYAIEFTDVAIQARKLIAGNGMSDVIEVIQSAAEDVVLSQKVDIIISEWMGYMLLKESFLDSVIFARDKWLKPDGCMFPSRGSIHVAATSRVEERASRMKELQTELAGWKSFSSLMKSSYNLDFAALGGIFEKEQRDFYVSSSVMSHLTPECVVGEPLEVKTLDFKTCTLQEVQGIDRTKYEITVPKATTVTGFAGWFVTHFEGSKENPAPHPVTLSTAPEAGHTHWGQQAFYLENALDCKEGAKLHGSLAMPRQAGNKRMYEMHLDVKVLFETHLVAMPFLLLFIIGG